MATQVFLLLLLSSSVSLALSHCPRNEFNALMNIKHAFGNPPSLSTWNASFSLDCCTWPFVWCDYTTGHVTDISLMSSDISGPISPSIAQLTSLKNLMIIFANLTGTIPSSIGTKLTSLTSIKIYTTSHLTGTIPRSFCNLKKLNQLDLSGNGLYGPIPNCSWKNLTLIDLSRNRLSGPVPRSLGDVLRLNSINLSQNKLTGDPSFLFGEKKNDLEVIDLSGNELKFDMLAVKFPLRLKLLDLNHNKIYGGIPSQMAKLKRLNTFNVSYNNLCGTTHAARFMKKFGRSSFQHNTCLCGKPLQPCRDMSRMYDSAVCNAV